MSTDPGWNFQAALYSALTGSSAVMALVNGVYDHAPEDQTTYPYLVIGDDTALDWSTKSFDGQELTITLHSWSRYRGRKEVKQIMDAVYTLLHNTPLTVSGQSNILLQFEFGESFLDDDGLTYHGVQRFRALTISN